MAGTTMDLSITNQQADESTRIVAAVATVTSVATLAVVARLYVRICMIRSFGWDDALISLTMVTSIVGFALTVVQAKNGAGRHFSDVPPDVYQYGLFVNFVNQPIYLFAICFVKLAVGAALMRIATKKMYKHMIMGVMVFMLFYTIACFFTIIFQCTDIRILWDPTTEATCWSAQRIRALSYTNAALNMLTDLLFSLIIPLPMLWRLHVNFRTWVTLTCILGLGIFACAAAAVKVSYLPNYGKQGDFLWDSRNITIWSATEVNVAIIAASLPPLRPLFKQVLNSTYARGSRGSSKNLPRGRKSWHELPSVERQAVKDCMSDGTESQTTFDLDNCRLHAFVHRENGTTTEIGQANVPDRENSPPGMSTLPKDSEKSIMTTKTMSVQYSTR